MLAQPGVQRRRFRLVICFFVRFGQINHRHDRALPININAITFKYFITERIQRHLSGVMIFTSSFSAIKHRSNNTLSIIFAATSSGYSFLSVRKLTLIVLLPWQMILSQVFSYSHASILHSFP